MKSKLKNLIRWGRLENSLIKKGSLPGLICGSLGVLDIPEFENRCAKYYLNMPIIIIIIHFITQRLSCHSRTLYNLKQEQTNNKTIKIKSASKNSMATTVRM